MLYLIRILSMLNAQYDWNSLDVKRRIQLQLSRCETPYIIRTPSMWNTSNLFTNTVAFLFASGATWQRSVPPHLCFNLGSMGFLAPFEYERMKEEVWYISNTDDAWSRPTLGFRRPMLLLFCIGPKAFFGGGVIIWFLLKNLIFTNQ